MNERMKEAIASAKMFEVLPSTSNIGNPPVRIKSADTGAQVTKKESRQADKIIKAEQQVEVLGDDDFGTIENFFGEMAHARRYDPYRDDPQFNRAIFASHRRLLVVGGVKGGPGKSTVAVSLIDYLISLGYKIVLIEGDRGTPDVGPAFTNNPAVKMIRLDCSKLEGVRELVKIMGHCPRVIVLNTGSGYDRTFQDFGSVLARAMSMYGYLMTCFFAMNSQSNSVEQLVKFHEAIPNATLHAVLNLKESQTQDIADFHEWADSPAREGIERQGRTLIMPYGPLALMNRMSKEGLSFSTLAEDINRDLTDRDLLHTFLRSMWAEFDRVFDFDRRS